MGIQTRNCEATVLTAETGSYKVVSKVCVMEFRHLGEKRVYITTFSFPDLLTRWLQVGHTVVPVNNSTTEPV